MGKMSKRKGAFGEREAARALNELFGWDAHRGRQYRGGEDSPDVAGLPPGLHVEVKRVERLQLWPALEQAREDAGPEGCPVVMHRPNRRPWVLIIELECVPRLLHILGEHHEA